MALATVGDFISSAMRKLGALRSGGTPTTAEQADFLDTANLLIRDWSNKRYLQAVQNTREFTWPANTLSRTIGPSGADFTSTRPQHILNAQLYDSGALVTYPMEIIPKEKYDAITTKSTGGISEFLCYEWSLTNGTIFLWRVITQSLTLQLSVLEPIAEYSTFSTAIGLPIEYHTGFLYNLCLMIAAELGVNPTREIILLASDSLNAIKELHSDPPPVVAVARELQTGIWGQSRWDINSGS